VKHLPSALRGFSCRGCGHEEDGNRLPWTCPECGGKNLVADYDYSRINKSKLRGSPPGVWKYGQLLPIPSPAVTLGEGGTPLIRCTKILDLPNLFVKDESRNPTSSFADRGSTVAISAAVMAGATSVVCATDGDTGASVAAYSAKAGLDCTIFAPLNAESGKLFQTLVYGAKIMRSPGGLRNSMIKCESACPKEGCQDLTIETCPHALEGEKTNGFEISDQLGWRSPDFIVVPAGSGTNLASIWRGCVELRDSGLVEDLPRMVAIQASACDPITRSFREGGEIQAQGQSNTIAPSIALGDPLNGQAAIRALEESRGTAYSFDDGDILRAVGELGSMEGVFAEPASAATICGARMLVDDGTADRSDTVVCVVTGSGLKVPDSITEVLKPRLNAAWDLVNLDEKALGPLGPTKIQLLEILGEEPSYGYSLWRQLDLRFGERISLQAIYQHLGELREMGLVERAPGSSSRNRGRKRNYFRLTSRGRGVFSSLGSIRDSIIGPGQENGT